MCAPVFSMDACKEAIEVHEGMELEYPIFPQMHHVGVVEKSLTIFIIQT
jgi:hypothetical protein